MKTRFLIFFLYILFIPLLIHSQVSVSTALESEIYENGNFVFLPQLKTKLILDSFFNLSRDLSLMSNGNFSLFLELNQLQFGYEYYRDVILRYRYDYWSISPFLEIEGTKSKSDQLDLPDTWKNLFILYLSYDTFSYSVFFDPQISWEMQSSQRLYFQGNTGISFQSSPQSFTTLKVSGQNNLIETEISQYIGFTIENEILAFFDWVIDLSVFSYASNSSELRLGETILPETYLEWGIVNSLKGSVDPFVFQIDIPFHFRGKSYKAIKSNQWLTENEWIINIDPLISADFLFLQNQNLLFTIEADLNLSNTDIENSQNFKFNLEYQYQF